MQKQILACVLLAGCTTLAQAHAFLDHAEPKVGSTLNASPSVVKIWFTEYLDAPSCKLQVFDATGKEIDKKDVKIDSAQKALMSVSMPKLPAGTYKVVWNAGCACGCNQHTSGKFTFVVAGP